MSNLLVQNIKHTNGTTAQTVDSSGRINKPLQPSFHAYPSSSTNYTSADDVIIFGSTYHNIGSDYNTSTGKFTAPIAGNYLFAWAVYRGDGDESASIHLLHNTTKKYEGRIDSIRRVKTPHILESRESNMNLPLRRIS